MMKLLITCLIVFWAFSGFGQEVNLRIPKGGNYRITDLSFSPDGKYVLTSHVNNNDFLWEIQSGKFVGGVRSATQRERFHRKSEFNIDGTCYLSILDRQEVAVDKIYEGNVGFIPYSDSSFTNYAYTYYSAKFSPDGKRIITATSDSTFEIWDINSLKRIARIKGHNDQVKNAEFSPNGQFIVTSSWDSTIIVWDVLSDSTFQKSHSIRYEGTLNELKISKNNLYLLTKFDNISIKVFDLQKGILINQLVLEENIKFESFDFHENNVAAAAGNKLIVWNFLAHEISKNLIGHQGNIEHFALHPTENTIASASSDSTIIVWNLDDGSIQLTLKTNFSPSLLAYSPSTAEFNKGGEYILCGSGHLAYVLDASTGKLLTSFEKKTTPIWNTVSTSINNKKLLCSYGSDGSLYYLNRLSGIIESHFSSIGELSLLAQLQENTLLIVNQNGSYSVNQIENLESIATGNFGHPVYFSRYNKVSGLIAATDWSKLSVHRINDSNNTISKIKVKDIDFLANTLHTFDFNNSGTQLLTGTTTGEITLWNISANKVKKKWTIKRRGDDDKWIFITDIKFLVDDKLAIIGTGNGEILLVNTESKEILKTLEDSYRNPKNFRFNKNGTRLLSSSESTVFLWEFTMDTMILVHNFNYSSDVYRAYFSETEDTIYAGSVDGSTRMWNSLTGEEIIQSYLFENDPNKWVHIHPSGLFDASPDAMELMYWTKGLEVIEFAQLKDRYWLPGLWEKVMKGEALPDVRDMQELKLQPEVEMGEMKDNKIPVTLTKRDGGYGKVSIFINGKEVEADTRGTAFDKSKETQTIWVDLKDHPNLENGENTIAVKASSEDGFVVGRPVEKKVTMTMKINKPHFYAVVVGTGKYMNSAINLKYPEKDAESMSTALKLGAEQLFGKENAHIYTLTTASGDRPTKEKIKAVFAEIGKTATSTDIVLVYLSGHGVAWGGNEGDFYYLTADATAANAEAYNDDALRKNYTISTNEFTEYLKAIPANKQVMIIDACGSGKAVDNLLASRNVDVSQIKAIDRMKDRTGMFVISGSSADKVSYEASRYGQGLLTYSILQGMKGAALEQGKFFDVLTMFNFSRESVPKLAAGIGGVQTPQILVPKGGSFAIGQVDEESKKQIPLSSIKPVFVRTTFVDGESFSDDLNLSKLIDEELNLFASRGNDAQIVFLDSREFPDAYRLSGGYTQVAGKITMKLKIKGPKESEHTITANSLESLKEKIMEIVEGLE